MHEKLLPILCLFLFTIPCIGQKSVDLFNPEYPTLPKKFQEYPVVTNPDSLENLIEVDTGSDSLLLLHRLISLELSRNLQSDKFGDALPSIEKLVKQYDDDVAKATYHYIHGYYKWKSNIEESISHYFNGLKLFENLADTVGIITIYERLYHVHRGSFNSDMGLVEDKAYYVKKLEQLATINQSALGLLIYYSSYVIASEDPLKKKEAIYKEAIKLIDKNPELEHMRYKLKTKMAICYNYNNLYSKSNMLNKEVIEHRNKNGTKIVIPLVFNTAHNYLYMDSLELAEKTFKKARQLYTESKENRPELLVYIHYYLGETQFKMKKFDEAWISRNVRDSLQKELDETLKYKEILNIQTKYKTQKKEIEIQILNNKQEQQSFKIGILTVFFVITVLSLLFILNLYNKNKTLSTKLEKQNQLLNESIKKQEYFTYILSHDALGYINHILNFSSALLSDNLNSSPLVERVYKNTKRLKTMTTNLIDYNKSKRLSPVLESVEPYKIVIEIQDDLKFEISQIDAELSFTKEIPLIKSNREMLKQVFKNIVENAIKYRNKNKKLQLNIDCEIKSSKYLIIYFKDNGQGIKPELVPTLFTEFSRGDNTSEGSGLGLFISKQIIESLGGAISVESTYGEGSIFMLTLPLTYENKTNLTS